MVADLDRASRENRKVLIPPHMVPEQTPSPQKPLTRGDDGNVEEIQQLLQRLATSQQLLEKSGAVRKTSLRCRREDVAAVASRYRSWDSRLDQVLAALSAQSCSGPLARRTALTVAELTSCS